MQQNSYQAGIIGTIFSLFVFEKIRGKNYLFYLGESKVLYLFSIIIKENCNYSYLV